MAKITNTILTYPSRGHWGKSDWRGNTSGHLVLDLIDTYEPATVLDPMEGSGTTREVCADKNIPYLGYDLKNGDDVLSPITQIKIKEDVKRELSSNGVDFIFLHPPYWSMIKYSNLTTDFSNGPYSLWINRMMQLLNFCSTLLSTNGLIALLLGDYRARSFDRTFFLTDDVTSEGQCYQNNLTKEIRLIKVQHMTESKGVTSVPGGIRFTHEYVTILRKRS